MQKITNFTNANKALLGFVPPDVADRKYSLDTMRDLMEFLGNPQDKIRVVHVAGTSGKTSTCYYLAAMLHSAGKKVGLTVSPHIDEINERVQIDMLPIPENEFCLLLNEFLEKIEDSQLNPSYFEVLVAFAYWVFAKKEVDYAIVEVGLGGLLDGTNVVNRQDKVCVITDIGLDHTHILGNTIKAISAQKAGIIQRQNKVFMYEQTDEVLSVVTSVCDQKSASLNVLSEDTIDAPDELPLFQRRNWLLAKQVVGSILDESSQKLSEKMLDESAQTIVPARMQVFERFDKTVIVDGSHNEQKIHALVESLRQKYPTQSIAALISFGHNKENLLEDSLKEIAGIVNRIVFTKFGMGQDEYRKPIEPDKLVKICQKNGFINATVDSDPIHAFQGIITGSEEIIIVTGSFYLLNHIRPLILNK